MTVKISANNDVSVISTQLLPTRIFIEPTDACNLRCPMCPCTAAKGARHMLDYAAMISVLDSCEPARPYVHFYGWGEPLLHPRFTDIVEYAVNLQFPVILSTNLNTTDTDMIDFVATSGARRIRVSVDAATADTYAKMRCGGDFELLIANLDRLVQARNVAQSDARIELAFVVSQENCHEIELFKNLAESHGVDTVRFKTLTLYSDNPIAISLPEDCSLHSYDPHSRQPRVTGVYCSMPFKGATITARGDVYPCAMCEAVNQHSYGNIHETPFREIWNSATATAMRTQMNRNPLSLTPCVTCPHAISPIKEQGWHRWEVLNPPKA